jgi:hypothetical protein
MVARADLQLSSTQHDCQRLTRQCHFPFTGVSIVYQAFGLSVLVLLLTEFLFPVSSSFTSNAS